jgi:hypothetical protein
VTGAGVSSTASLPLSVAVTATGAVTINYRLVDLSSGQVYTSNILLGRYSIESGNTLLYTGGVVTVTDSPLDTDLAAADWYVLGGHDRTLTASQVADLQSAGYGALVETA